MNHGNPTTGSSEQTPSQRYPLIRWQKPMIGVLVALVPCIASALYRFGWRTVAILAACAIPAFLAEWLFTRSRKEPVSSAVFVTAALLALTLPPTIPLWMAALGAGVAIVFAKECFGGFGRNIFNPALTGRCFMYVCFANAMSVRWTEPASGGAGALATWVTPGLDAITKPTPLSYLRNVIADPTSTVEAARLPGHLDLLLGHRAGCLGETAALAIIAGGAYLIARRYADWRLMLSAVLGLLGASLVIWLLGIKGVRDPVWNLLSGGFLFGAVFMVTDPVSAPRRPLARWAYGLLVGALTVIIRRFGVFPEGTMFAILLMNAFNPSLDLLAGALDGRQRRAKDEP